MSTIKPCSDGVWLGRSRFVLVDCGRWNSDQSRHSDGAWQQISRQRSSRRMRTDTIWPLPTVEVQALFTATAGNNRSIYKPTSPRSSLF
ncbi:hypothetical protein AVEN_24526-1 [Araneus ventricosus]|uniref:Uncharacterized protein n=1 Tax=Araneus ventricosus TaxID=182803 RepID=A0A4Y2VYU7_ARAVE|nr:hypothetical protein AVEN_24526-1 [Araneus ventricosus]